MSGKFGRERKETLGGLREMVKDPAKGSDTWLRAWNMVVRSAASSGRRLPASRAVSNQGMRSKVRPTDLSVYSPPPSKASEGPLWVKTKAWWIGSPKGRRILDYRSHPGEAFLLYERDKRGSLETVFFDKVVKDGSQFLRDFSKNSLCVGNAVPGLLSSRLWSLLCSSS